MRECLETIKDEYYYQVTRGSLVTIHSSDWHFGAYDPKLQYDTLNKELFNLLDNIKFDMFFIQGDLTDSKTMASSDNIMYASMAIARAVNLCIKNNATLVLLGGTKSHDADQLKLFYHYIYSSEVDIRIIESIDFIYAKNAKILCIPEEYGKGSEYYDKYLFQSGEYDFAIVHGMFKGAVVGHNAPTKDGDHSPVFCIEDFVNCRSFISAGHIHTAGCFAKYFYYTGSPYRWEYGEEQDKGFLIGLVNLDTFEHYLHFEKINCLTYITMNLDTILSSPPDQIVSYIKQQKDINNIDFLRVQFLIAPNEAQLNTLEILKKYFRNNSTVKIDTSKLNDMKKEALQENKALLDKYAEYSYITDPNLTPEEIFVRYVNQEMKCEYISLEELMSFLTE